MNEKQKTKIEQAFNRYINHQINECSYASALGSAESFVRFLIEDVPGAAEYVKRLLEIRGEKC